MRVKARITNIKPQIVPFFCTKNATCPCSDLVVVWPIFASHVRTLNPPPLLKLGKRLDKLVDFREMVLENPRERGL